jgi:hypothetical protein
MPRQEDFKRLVRLRMRKTGEAYTTARARILEKKASIKPTAPAARTAASAAVSPAHYAELAGMSDAALKANTGCTWERWVRALDRVGAAEMPHRDLARLIRERWKIDGWWAQTVTVGYERIKGLRDRGQRRGGSYEATKSKTFKVSVGTLYRAFADAKTRRRWLTGASPAVRTAIRDRSMRLGWEDGTIVALWFTAKGDAKSAVSVQHMKLPDRAAAQRWKDYWAEKLAAVGRVLPSSRVRTA